MSPLHQFMALRPFGGFHLIMADPQSSLNLCAPRSYFLKLVFQSADLLFELTDIRVGDPHGIL